MSIYYLKGNDQSIFCACFKGAYLNFFSANDHVSFSCAGWFSLREPLYFLIKDFYFFVFIQRASPTKLHNLYHFHEKMKCFSPQTKPVLYLPAPNILILSAIHRLFCG